MTFKAIEKHRYGLPKTVSKHLGIKSSVCCTLCLALGLFFAGMAY